MPSLYSSAAVKSTFHGFKKVLHKRQGPYQIVDVNDNTRQILQDCLEHTFSIHQATLPANSTRYCDSPDREKLRDEQSSKVDAPRSHMEPEVKHHNADKLCVVGTAIGYAGLALKL